MLPLIAAGIEAAPEIGSAIGAAAMKWGPALLGAIPLIQDLVKGGADPEKIAQVKKMRDDRVEQLMGADPSNNRNKATAQANDEFKEMMDKVENDGKASGGEIATDLAGLAGDVALGHFAARGMKPGKKVNSNAPVSGGPTTATEGVNGKLSAVPPARAPKMVNAAPEVEVGTGSGQMGNLSPTDHENLQIAMMKAQMQKRAMNQSMGMPGIEGG